MARARDSRNLLAGVVGVAAGAAAAGGTWWLRRWQRGETGRGSDERGLELQVVDALCDDEIAGSCAIDVSAVGRGVIELSGTVPDEESAEHAAMVAQAVPGVHTVVNRLDVEMLEQHLADTRRRREEGAPELQQSGWEGMGSGMGARRQGATDPSRPDDSISMKEDALGLDGPIR